MKARVPKGFGGSGPSNMQDMIKQAQKMQTQMADIQAELEATTYTASVGGGAVEATVTGKKEISALTIKPEVIDPEDAEMLQDLVISAVNEALRNAEADSDERLASVTGNANLPFGL